MPQVKVVGGKGKKGIGALHYNKASKGFKSKAAAIKESKGMGVQHVKVMKDGQLWYVWIRAHWI
jgi:hypothetical protein